MTFLDLRNHASLFFASLLLAACSGCAQLGLATPESFNEKVVVAYAACTHLRETATTLLAQKKITVEDAVNIQASADVARTGIDAARRLHASDPASANAKLDAIRTGLTALSTYLAAKKGS